MSKRRVCDICGKTISSWHYKFKQTGHLWDGTDVGHKFDMCESCFGEFERYIQNKKLTEPKPPKGGTAIQDF